MILQVHCNKLRAFPQLPGFALFLLEPDSEKAFPAFDPAWLPVLPRDKREAFARRSCSNRSGVAIARKFITPQPARDKGSAPIRTPLLHFGISDD
jgi:hypothetical protein